MASPVLAGELGLLLWLERRRPLRRPTRPRRERFVTNGAVGLTASLVMRALVIPAAVAVAIWAGDAGFGLLRVAPLPPPAAAVIGVLLLDYTTYVWHWLNHRLPLLWRFHSVHHTDLDLDVTTAFRFHVGELVLSVVYRSAQVALIGVGPILALIYEVLLMLATEFHHSNWQLPLGLERRLSWLVVTPRMHGIHHSIVERETNSNWSNIFSVWDRLHRTLRLNVPHEAIVIGLPAYRDAAELTFPRLLAMPFGPQRPTWRLPFGGHPDRAIVGDAKRLAG